MNKKFVILGSGSYAKNLKEDMHNYDSSLNFYGYLSKEKNKNYFRDKDIKKLKKINNIFFINGIGNFSYSWYEGIFKAFKKKKIKFLKLIHNSSLFYRSSKILEGAIVMENTIVKSNTTIGKFCLINSSAVIAHDVKIKDFSTVSLGAKIAGNCTVGRNTFVGMNSTIVNNINVGNNVIVGAGSVVVEDIQNNVIVAGNPAKVIKRR